MMKNSKFKSILTYILVFILIIGTDSFWVYTWDNRILFNIFNIGILISSFLSLIIFFLSRKRMLKKYYYIFFLYALGIFTCSVINFDFSSGYMMKISFCILGILLARFINFKNFSSKFINVMLFLSVYSLIIYMLDIVGFTKFFPIVNNINQIPFYNGFLTLIPVHGDTITRNWGLFWEPGTFQAYLCLSLVLSVFYVKEKQLISFLIFSLCILSTFSTTGIICYILILLAIILNTGFHKHIDIKYYLISLFAIIPLIFIIILNEDIFYLIFSKFTPSDLSESASLGARLYSIFGNLKITLSSGFLFGTGVQNYNEIYVNTVNSLGYFKDMSNTNTFLVDFARYGLLVGGINVFLYYNFSKMFSTKLSVKIILLLVFLILLFMENFSYSLFWMTICFFGLNNKNFIDERRKYNIF